ncbi:DUF1949 domain-containing protein [Granulosicoccaceae sp. 1_MG-2023]|nr:DUF1949 domain-containing protein [Granulosicoccaceae sp. 1_MG-2023]
MPYPLEDSIRRLIQGHQGVIGACAYTTSVTLHCEIPADALPALEAELTDSGRGDVICRRAEPQN